MLGSCSCNHTNEAVKTVYVPDEGLYKHLIFIIFTIIVVQIFQGYKNSYTSTSV